MLNEEKIKIMNKLAMYEQGERIPRDDIKIKIASYYNRTVDFIFFAKIEHEKCSEADKVPDERR